MLVVFRADASVQIGTGHVMRCLTLAEELRRQGHQCQFVCRDHPGHLGELIESKGFGLHLLSSGELLAADITGSPYAQWLGVTWQQDARQTLEVLCSLSADWLVVDHYALDRKWEQVLAGSVGEIMVIDDLANRPHECALLLDQNLGRTNSDYDELVPSGCQRLIGPRYALLRPEFAELRERSLKRRENPKLNRILISLGGVDRNNMTGQVLKALSESELPASTELDIIMGSATPYLDEVQQQAAQLPFKVTVSVNVTDMADRMCLADLAIGAAGGTSWERCCLGLPTVLVILAENQVAGAKALALSGAAKAIGAVEPVAEALASELASLAGAETLKCMSEVAASITMGHGVLSVAEAMKATVGRF